MFVEDLSQAVWGEETAGSDESAVESENRCVYVCRENEGRLSCTGCLRVVWKKGLFM